MRDEVTTDWRMKMEITNTQIHAAIIDEKLSFSMNYAIDDSFMIQLGEDGKFSIPTGNEASWNDAAKQDAAFEQYDANELAKELGLPTELSDIYECYSPDFYGDNDAKELINEMISANESKAYDC